VSPTLISIGFGLYELLPEFPTMLTATFPSSIGGGDDEEDEDLACYHRICPVILTLTPNISFCFFNAQDINQ